MSNMAAARQVFMFAFSSCYSMELKTGPGETRKLLFHSYIIEYRPLTLAKTDAEIYHTYPRHRD